MRGRADWSSEAFSAISHTPTKRGDLKVVPVVKGNKKFQREELILRKDLLEVLVSGFSHPIFNQSYARK